MSITWKIESVADFKARNLTKGAYCAKVSIHKKQGGAADGVLFLAGDDDGAFDANDAPAIHAKMIAIDKAKDGIYRISPVNPEQQGGTPQLKCGRGGNPYLSTRKDASTGGSFVKMA